MQVKLCKTVNFCNTVAKFLQHKLNASVSLEVMKLKSQYGEQAIMSNRMVEMDDSFLCASCTTGRFSISYSKDTSYISQCQ